ncbi:1,6-anhydro-N-acetylmuramyl-L-alanine amidase AmpD [Paraburkholderia bonniea]|uniref:1,6-anhydro-N-acetylmuramyl-L-alanine amidase AmpD n=1 Tax=Paraburkholderia bonniea TaxID=2152891 RepID=UPI00129231FC|nr:1,6-anhydro-N-acetylmuramyl-L-alanine amidase AmpD [Paraburkholderia bonniea]WJF89902.1 1,6-anhydro-N-acetylmuramyl-L-alanine amidase AmpD [Paraburkholderia bonniea]WJF93216.1 1,6-anhydro-N-acetylmuramyl-L-alanine amidase AmpD [Paraburkholderia bonniea]
MSASIAIAPDGWSAAAHLLPSPNADERPEGVVPTLVVIHNISLPPDTFGGSAIAELFQNALDCAAHPYYDSHLRGVRVSAHFVIHRTGMLEQFVSCNRRAWHAGLSNFLGRERCNDFSVGIELEGSDTTPFTSPQYQVLARLVTALIERYPMTAIAGHSDLAPGRKTDPGPYFDWARLQSDTALPADYFPYLKPPTAR